MKKIHWRAWHRTPLQHQAFGPELSEAERLENNQHEASSQSDALQQWLDAGGQADKASLYNVEIFAGTA